MGCGRGASEDDATPLGRGRGPPRRGRAAARRSRPCGHHDPARGRGGRRQSRARPLLLRLDRELARPRARALHGRADRAPAGDVRDRRPLHRQVAAGDALSRRRRRRVREDLVRAPGARLEPARPARARGARQRRMAFGAARGIRGATPSVWHPDAARGARLPRDYVQRRHHSRAALRDHHRSRRAARLDRRVAGAEGEGAMAAVEEAVIATPEQTRARYTDEEGYVERDGVRVFYEVYGEGEPTVLLLPTWSIIHSRHWKMQIPYLARHCRVVTFDGRGNGRSDRPTAVEAYAEREYAADALAVMDATGTERAVIVGLSAGTLWGVLLAAEHPERVEGAAFIGAAQPFAQHL